MSTERKARILLADDETDVALVTRMRLEVNGFDVVLAVDGEDALAKFRESKPDLVLLDLRMPRLDGYEVCRALKTDPVSRGVPVIIFSASSSAAVAIERQCMELGVEDHIRKPYHPGELIDKIRRRLPNHAVPVRT